MVIGSHQEYSVSANCNKYRRQLDAVFPFLGISVCTRDCMLGQMLIDCLHSLLAGVTVSQTCYFQSNIILSTVLSRFLIIS